MMKRLLALFLLAVSSILHAQTPVNGDYRYPGNVYFDKGLFLPVRDTVGGFPYRVGAQAIRPQDTVGHPLSVPVYTWTGSRWMNLSSGGGSTYTAGNGLTLSGAQFVLGGVLASNTNISTGSSIFSLNYGATNRPALTIGDSSKIGYNEPGGAFSGYSYVHDYGRGKHLLQTNGVSALRYDYSGLFLYDTLGLPVASLLPFGPFQLKQSNGNNFLDVGLNRFYLGAASDTAFYVDNTQIITRALSNSDPAKVVGADASGRLHLVTAPSADTTSLSNRINLKEDYIPFGTGDVQYLGGDKLFYDLNVSAVPGLQDSLNAIRAAGGGGGADSTVSLRYVGRVYDRSAWSDLSDFAVNTVGATVSGGAIHLPDAGVTDFTKSLQLAGYSCVNHWKAEVIFTLDEAISGSTTGLSVGIQSANSDALCSWAVYFRAADDNPGHMEFFSQSNGGSWISNDAAGNSLTFDQGEQVKLSIERVNDMVYLRAQNLSDTQSDPVYYEIKTNFNDNPVAPNTGRFAIWGQGGEFTINRFTVYNNEIRNPDVMFVGDSKTLGYGATSFYKTVPGLLGRRYKNVSIGAGFGDKTADVINRLPEIIRIKPKQVLLNIGCNDERFGVGTATAITNIDTIIHRLGRAGIPVRLMTPGYETGLDLYEMYYGITNNWPDAIDVMRLFEANDNLYTDGIHWSDKGNAQVAALVIDSNAISGVKTDQEFIGLGANNGLTLSGNTVTLGGELTQNTTIAGGDKDFSITRNTSTDESTLSFGDDGTKFQVNIYDTAYYNAINQFGEFKIDHSGLRLASTQQEYDESGNSVGYYSITSNVTNFRSSTDLERRMWEGGTRRIMTTQHDYDKWRATWNHLPEEGGNVTTTILFDSSGLSMQYKPVGEIDPVTYWRVDSIGKMGLYQYRNNASEDSVLTTDIDGNLKFKYVPDVPTLEQVLNVSSTVNTPNPTISMQATDPDQSAQIQLYEQSTGATTLIQTFQVDGASWSSIYLGSDSNYISSFRDLKFADVNGKVYAGANFDGTFTDGEGRVRHASRTVAGTYTAVPTDYTIIVANTGGAATINLPSAVTNARMILVIKKTSGSGNDVTIDPFSSQVIDADATRVLTKQFSSVVIQSNGSSWMILASHVGDDTL